MITEVMTVLVVAQTQVVTPRRVVQVMPVELKVSGITVTVPTPSGTPATSTNELQQPTEFGSGLTEMLLSALAPSRSFLPQETGGAPPPPASWVLRASITELSLESRAGLAIQGASAIGSRNAKQMKVGLDLRLVEASTGLVLESVHVSGSAEMVVTNVDWQKGQKVSWSLARSASLGEAARRAFDAGVRKLDLRFATQPWEGLVVELGEEAGSVALYVNAGQRAGLKTGDLLEIRRPGPALRDPESGQSLGRAPGRVLGRARVHSLTETLSIVLPLGPGTFQIGDTVRFLSRDKK